MRRLAAVAPFILLLALLAACGAGDKLKAVATPALFPPDENWRLEYSRSGGIAAIQQSLTLDWRGNLDTADKRTGRTGHGYVVPADVGLVRGMLRGLNLPTLKSDQGFPVPDAIVLSIKVTSGDKTYGATLNNLPADPNLAGLLRRLDALYDAYKP